MSTFYSTNIPTPSGPATSQLRACTDVYMIHLNKLKKNVLTIIKCRGGREIQLIKKYGVQKLFQSEFHDFLRKNPSLYVFRVAESKHGNIFNLKIEHTC